ncbi:hypothetical protein RYX56_05480 [Alkalihalophilus lindianensis]|uniref:Uncharacterized protein n=1 Tax=Alkalihalophilus lindianensis TaxID=1630542 RepID=A0ABU3X7F2_9BACI|nr:hypothetical protein [Alkalihalophilus lindianensis]MDV2683759.1 hypothetical protein [Alkalihalophilus lindianensis]MDV2683825.1 hypothetical protein [Alkalihalophilus lindianensis]
MEDVQSFKRGLAAIMYKHHVVSFRGNRGGFIGYFGGKRSMFLPYCFYKQATLPGTFSDILDYPKTNIFRLTKDLRDLFNYYNVRCIKSQHLENFFIVPDDNNHFLMENVDIEFFEKKEGQRL